jgi:hypothetical protein
LVLPPAAVEQARASIANATAAAHGIGGTDGQQLLAVARQGFIDGASTGLRIASVVAAVGAIAAWRFLPTHTQAKPGPNRSGGSDATLTPPQPSVEVVPPVRRASSPIVRNSDIVP